MTNEANPLIQIDLPLHTWRFIRDVLLSLKRATEQPKRPYEHRGRTLRLIDKTPDAHAMLDDATWNIAEAIANEVWGPALGRSTSLDSPIETTFPEVKP